MGWLLVHSKFHEKSFKFESSLILSIEPTCFSNMYSFLFDHTNDVPTFSSIAVYKALYKSFGGFAADVVAAIDQVCLSFGFNFGK